MDSRQNSAFQPRTSHNIRCFADRDVHESSNNKIMPSKETIVPKAFTIFIYVSLPSEIKTNLNGIGNCLVHGMIHSPGRAKVNRVCPVRREGWPQSRAFFRRNGSEGMPRCLLRCIWVCALPQRKKVLVRPGPSDRALLQLPNPELSNKFCACKA